MFSRLEKIIALGITTVIAIGTLSTVKYFKDPVYLPESTFNLSMEEIAELGGSERITNTYGSDIVELTGTLDEYPLGYFQNLRITLAEGIEARPADLRGSFFRRDNPWDRIKAKEVGEYIYKEYHRGDPITLVGTFGKDGSFLLFGIIGKDGEYRGVLKYTKPDQTDNQM